MSVRRASGLGVVAVMLLGAAGPARADVTLQNDGFNSGDTAVAEAGFVSGEAGAVRLVAPDAGRQLLKVQLLFGGNSTATDTMTLLVWDDTAGTDIPGTVLSTSDFQLTGNDSALQELDLTSANVIVPKQFRVGLMFQHDGAPTLFRDNDGTVAADKNFILANGTTWIRSQSAGVQGDWIIRAVVSGATDAGATMDAPMTGQTCTGNAGCPTGQFCDLQSHACTFDCRTAADCPANGTCNSLGMCVGGTGGGGGGCCDASEGGGRGASFLALATLGLMLGRRRRREPRA